jgi:hypothetical protein
LGSLKGRDNPDELDTDERAILKWILRKSGVKVWTAFI